jgi:asparagine synthase (glutamine-hydrolysing)
LEIPFQEAAEETGRLIEGAVRARLMSDVPLGAFLSGGLDSSTVVAHLARISASRVKTFSIAFREQQFDESSYARLVASTFATDHQEFVVEADQTADLPLLARHLGEPFADSSIVPSYHVARITRPHVTVAMNGDGGDELFGGYDRYRAALIAELIGALAPLRIRAALARSGNLLPRSANAPRWQTRIRRFLLEFDQSAAERQIRWTGFFTGKAYDRVVGPRIRELAPIVESSLPDLLTTTDAAESFMARDILTTLPGDLLVKMDIATMANSLEARSPLLDQRLAEFVARLPTSYKVNTRQSKILLRRAMAGVLPKAILNRRKMGFGVPIASWLRGPLRPLVEDLVLSPVATDRGFVDPSVARTLADQHFSLAADHGPLLWNLLMLELWFRECVHAPAPHYERTDALSISTSRGA